MAYTVIVAIEVAYGIASLLLISLGLAVIFGMMRIINLAHGEFLVLGSYAAIFATHHGVNIWISMFLVAPASVAIAGLIIERTIIRSLYGRLIDTMLASWGLSLLIVGLLTALFGDNTEGISPPLGAVSVSGYQASGYSLLVIAVAIATVGLTYTVFRFTRIGLFARGTMQNPMMASCLGIDTAKLYAVTFATGAGLAGLAGGVLAPITGVFPTIGASYIVRPFITVICGGPGVLAGTSAASLFFGVINQAMTFAADPVFGEVALLLAAVVIIRVLPHGITGRFFSRGI